jgi:hypothetical protein
MSKSSKSVVGVVVVVIIVVVTLGFVYFLIQGSFAKPTYSFSNNSLIITGQYGVEIDLSETTLIHQLSLLPPTEAKTNGAAIGEIKRGYFKINGSKVYLNIMDKSASNYILITDKDGSKYYINCASPEETNNLYNEISKNMDSTK